MSEDTLRELRTRGESLFSSLQRGFYSNLSGLSKKSEIEDIFNSHNEFKEPELYYSIDEKIKADDENSTGLRLLRAFLADMHIMSRISNITDRILTLEASSTIKSGNNRIPYRSSETQLMNEPKKKTRDEIETNRTKPLEKLNPLLLETVYLAGGASENLGFSSYLELKEHTESIDTEALSEEAKVFIRDTEYVSKEMLEWFFVKLMEFPLKDASSADLSYMLNSYELKGGFPKKEYVTCGARLLDDSGLVNSSAVFADSEKRKSKSFGSYLFPTSPPNEMKVSIYPAGGPYDYESYMSALGSALSYAFTDMDDTFEYRCLRDPAQTEIFSELFKRLIFDRKWLDRYIDKERGDDFFKLLFLRRLMAARSEAGRAVYQVLLYSGEDKGNIEETYKDIMEEALHVRVNEKDFLTVLDVREPMRSVYRFKALLSEPSLSKHLKEKFDYEWWRVKEAGAYLKNLWSQGGRCTSNELFETSGFDGTSAGLREIFESELS